MQVEHELARRNIDEESFNCVSSTTENTGVSVIRFHRRSSVIKSPCEFVKAVKFFDDKLANETALIYMQYIQTEQENVALNLQNEDLDKLVKQQDYELACLNYDLEKINQAKIALIAKLNEEISVVQPEVEQVPSSTVAEVPQHHAYHKVDREKEPEIYCVCGVKFTTKQNLQEHIKYNTFRTNFNCDVCGIWKHGLNQLRTHMKVTHGISSAYLASLKGCRLCGKLFTTLAQIHEHRRTQQ